MSNSTRRRINWTQFKNAFSKFGAAITVAAIALFGFWGGHFLLPGQEHSKAEVEEIEVANSVTQFQVTLPRQKLEAANLVVANVDETEFQVCKAIPGRVAYDSTRKVQLRATVACVVKEILTSPNQHIEQGDPLFVLTGPGVGSVRSEIDQCEAELALLKKKYEWTAETQANIKELLAMLDQSPSTDEIQSRFDQKKLGEQRSEILSSYSELALARQLSRRADRLEASGAISGKLADQRRSAFESALAKYRAIREEMAFQTAQQLEQAQANLEAGKKRLAMCKQRLESLLGPTANATTEMGTATPGIDSGGGNSDKAASISDFVFNAPQTGQVVALQAVTASRFEPGEVMAEIADTSVVWIEAQVSQRDWYSVTLNPGQRLFVRIPSLPNENFTAVVKHIGAEISPETMAIPLVAELENPDGRFRPGMSVWVDMPVSETRSAIVVPEGAVQRNQREVFVFVQTDDASFEKREVVLGGTSKNQIEIKSGLSAGDQVVVEGAFFLKSEMLLAAEDD